MRVRKSRVSAKCTPGLLPLKGSEELRGLQRKGSDEHREPAENHAFGFGEKIVAPVEHGAYANKAPMIWNDCRASRDQWHSRVGSWNHWLASLLAS